MANHDYTEILVRPDDTIDEANLGRMVLHLLDVHKKPVVVYVTDEDDPRPWATNNVGNVNRGGPGK